MPAWDAVRAVLEAPAPAEAVYQKDDRSVVNWRLQASLHLDLDPSIARAFAEGGDPRAVSRCVKLNNYWCIKGTGWNGMIAADPEGHAAFASAPEGAAVAALLLRRYYLEFSRRSAQAVVSRWAPAQCGLPVTPVTRGGTRPGGSFRLAQARRPLGPAPGTRVGPLATRGLGNTLRARYLASRSHVKKKFGASDWPGARRRSLIANAPLPAPDIPPVATGLGEIEIKLGPQNPAALSRFAARLAGTRVAALPGASSVPLTTCADDSVRLANYAQKIIDGVTTSIDEDLKLFEPDGTPTDRLARVMANMASVEIGPLKANDALVQTAIAAATATARRAAESARTN